MDKKTFIQEAAMRNVAACFANSSHSTGEIASGKYKIIENCIKAAETLADQIYDEENN